MKDMFGKHINVNDTIIHVSRQSSSTYLTVARVMSVDEKRIKVMTLAGNDYEWQRGASKFDSVTGAYTMNEFTGRETTWRTSNLVMVANGINTGDIHDRMMEQQRAELAKFASRTLQK